MGELRSKGRWSLINEIASYPGAALRRVFLIGYFLHSRGIGWRLSFREMHFLLFAPGLVDSTSIKGETAFPFLRWYPTNFSFIQAIISWIRNYSKYDTIFSTHHMWIIRNKTVWIFIDTSSGQKCQSKVQPLSRVYLHGFYGYLFILHIINLSST